MEVFMHGRIFAGLLRSEEHTSELQSHVNLVCRLLLEKKKILGFDIARRYPSRLHGRHHLVDLVVELLKCGHWVVHSVHRYSQGYGGLVGLVRNLAHASHRNLGLRLIHDAVAEYGHNNNGAHYYQGHELESTR